MKFEEAMRQKGVLDGLANNQQWHLQRGFDTGFENGAVRGFQTGESIYNLFKRDPNADFSHLGISQVLK